MAAPEIATTDILSHPLMIFFLITFFGVIGYMYRWLRELAKETTGNGNMILSLAETQKDIKQLLREMKDRQDKHSDQISSIHEDLHILKREHELQHYQKKT